ncbi:MAG: hypothetical protein NTV98_02875, partial [Candidatus Roizmanbacteria bacterium]|nr:hypothetical protein [Candidatus Roizmanbacteria bacterium]
MIEHNVGFSSRLHQMSPVKKGGIALAFGLPFVLELTACSAPTTPESIPPLATQIPSSVEPPQPYVSTNTPTIITPTPESGSSIQIFTESPPQWATGETEVEIKKRMSQVIFGQLQERPDQFVAAQNEGLPDNYLHAVVNIDYESADPWGGTATCIGVNQETGQSIFVTASHVLLDNTSQFHIKQPISGLDMVITGDQMTIARSPAGFFNDVAVIKLPFIPAGTQAFPFAGSGQCVSEQPTENAPFRSFAFPYMNKSEGGNGFTQFLSEGVVESVGDPATNMATCWYENTSQTLFVPTTMPT